MNPTIITISREYGSGGHQIGRKVAEQLQIPFYDREIIEQTAKESGFTPEFVEGREERLSNSVLYNFALGTIYGISYPQKPKMSELPVTEQLFLAQRKVIEDLVSKGSCVIVGRCADYILKDYPNLLKIFLYADPVIRQRRAIQEYQRPAEYIKEILAQIDKMRRIYYETYTVNRWGAKENYHLMLDTGLLGIDNCVDLICQAVHLLSPDKHI